MNPQLAGIVRAALSFAFGWMATKGVFPTGWVDTAVGIGGAVAVAVWSYYSNSTTSMLNSVAKSPDVHEITVEPSVANQVPSEKVVPLA